MPRRPRRNWAAPIYWYQRWGHPRRPADGVRHSVHTESEEPLEELPESRQHAPLLFAVATVGQEA